MFSFFFFNDTATTEIYTLSLHDALPISRQRSRPSDSSTTVLTEAQRNGDFSAFSGTITDPATNQPFPGKQIPLSRSEEHTSELQSQSNLVCRLLLEKKKDEHVPQLHTAH